MVNAKEQHLYIHINVHIEEPISTLFFLHFLELISKPFNYDFTATAQS